MAFKCFLVVLRLMIAIFAFGSFYALFYDGGGHDAEFPSSTISQYFGLAALVIYITVLFGSSESARTTKNRATITALGALIWLALDVHWVGTHLWCTHCDHHSFLSDPSQILPTSLLVLIESIWTFRYAKKKIREDIRGEVLAQAHEQQIHILVPAHDYQMQSLLFSPTGEEPGLATAAPAYTRYPKPSVATELHVTRSTDPPSAGITDLPPMSKAVGSTPEPVMELPLTRPRRSTRQTKASAAAALVATTAKDMHVDTDTAENSSVTPESESNAEDEDPKQEEEEEQLKLEEEDTLSTPQLKEDSESDDDSESNSEDESEQEASSDSSSSDSEGDQNKDNKEEEEDENEDDDEDLSHLLIKARESLKQKAMFDNSREEPRFSFPKLQNKLEADKVYLQKEGGKVKINQGTVVVVDKNQTKVAGGVVAAKKAKSGGPLETCEVNMNAEKVHISKKQKQEVEFEEMATESMVEKEKTAGKGWFDMPQQVLTPELKRDLQILKLRNVLDPKRFYKREDKSKPKFPKYFQVGTIIEGNTEFYSSRLTKKERATTITGEIMKDDVGRDYYKRKFNEIQEAKQSGGKSFYKKGKGKQSKSWRAGK
ncbi:hypothetical protein BGZ94_001169 [Podila epigama]|nr:hypothetical protein BGZ94_001169 [Podila epigama]